MNKKALVLQEEASDCGACCLLSIIRYFNGNMSLEQLRYMTNTTSAGVNAYDLTECAKKIGFSVLATKNESIDHLKVPFIAHLKINESLYHFVVVYEICDKYILVMDPALGFKRVKPDEFNAKFSGVSLQFYPNTTLPRYNIKSTIVKEIISSIKKNKKYYIKICLLEFIFIILSIVSSFSVDFLSKFFKPSFLLLLILILCLKNAIDYIISCRKESLKNIVSTEVSKKFLNHIYLLPLKYLHIKDSKEIIKRIDELDSLKEFYSKILINLVMNIFLITPIILMIIFYSISIFTIFSFYIIVIIIFTLLFIKFKKYTSIVEELIEYSTNYNSKSFEFVNGITSIKHINNDNQLKMLYPLLVKNKNCEEKYMSIINELNAFLNIFKETFGMIILILLIVNNVSNYLSIYFLINILIQLSMENLGFIPDGILLKKYVNKINDFYNLEEQKQLPLRQKSGDILIDKLSFSYNNSDYILKDLCEHIKAGEHVLIKGSSGSGKSTLCKILNREYDYDGSIKFKGRELSKIKYNFITYTSQNEYIFSDTIKNNILMGREVSDDYLNHIIKICKIDLILGKRMNGVNHYIHDEKELSGGEKQRIILARTLINASNFIILDETLSEVNKKMEVDIISDVLSFIKNKTVIYVTHKDNVDNYFDRIIYV